MLSRIFIKNFALINTLDIHLYKGLQVITGETGAGKSIMLGALRLILGERADVKAIADSESKSIVEAHFAIPDHLEAFFEENDLDYEKNSIIRREILPSGKSRAFVNDVPVTLDILLFQIIEKPPPLPDEFQEPPAGVVILLVLFEVVRKIGYSSAEQRDLDLRRSRVSGVQLEIADNPFSFFDIQHCDFSSLR